MTPNGAGLTLSAVTPQLIAAGVAISFFASMCQAVTGFGFALTMTPLMVLIWDVKPTVATSIVLGLFILFPLLAEARGSVSVPRVSWLLAGFALGAIPGIILLKQLDEDALRILVAVAVILACVLMSRTRVTEGASDTLRGRLTAGFISGAVGTSTSMGGPPIALYLLPRVPDVNAFRATILAFFLPANFLIVALFIVFGQVTGDVLVMSGAGLPAMVIGVVAGMRLRRRLDPARHRAVVLGFLVVTSSVVLAGTLAHLA